MVKIFKKKTTVEEGYADILVSRKQIEDIAKRYELSEHAKMRLIRRGGRLDFNVKANILSSPLAWKSKNKTIAVAFDLYRYIIVTYENERRKPVVVTMIDTKSSGQNVVDKMLIDYQESVKENTYSNKNNSYSISR